MVAVVEVAATVVVGAAVVAGLVVVVAAFAAQPERSRGIARRTMATRIFFTARTSSTQDLHTTRNFQVFTLSPEFSCATRIF